MYSAIAANKRETWLLIAFVSAILIGLFYLLGTWYGVNATTSVVFGTLFSTVYALFSYYFSDSIALSASGAREITKADAPELWNIVENLCIANGQPMPKVHIIPDAAMNAFATGRDPQHAHVAFTTGILQALTRTELEGVAAHELSHVKNYDIRVMTIVVVLIGAIMLVADILLRSIAFSRSDRREGNVGLLLMVVGLVLAILSPFLAELIKLAVSRKREYLADASGALLTRHPEGLASALAKISQNPALAKSNHATAHLFIANPFALNGDTKPSFWQSLFSTHPPVAERIARLQHMGR